MSDFSEGGFLQIKLDCGSYRKQMGLEEGKKTVRPIRDEERGSHQHLKQSEEMWILEGVMLRGDQVTLTHGNVQWQKLWRRSGDWGFNSLIEFRKQSQSVIDLLVLFLWNNRRHASVKNSYRFIQLLPDQFSTTCTSWNFQLKRKTRAAVTPKYYCFHSSLKEHRPHSI